MGWVLRGIFYYSDFFQHNIHFGWRLLQYVGFICENFFFDVAYVGPTHIYYPVYSYLLVHLYGAC